MTQETKIVFDLSDIVHVRIECKEASCGGELLVPLKTDDLVFLPEDCCPYCKRPWNGSGQRRPEFGFITALRSLAGVKDSPFRLKFEMDREPER